MTKIAWYLDDSGYEIGERQFLTEAKSWHAAVLHLPMGNFTFPVAILTCNAKGYHDLDFADPIATFEDFCNRTGREHWVRYDDEFNEDWTTVGLAAFESWEDYLARLEEYAK
jgi:hypothetical protein